jgi:hypothetical protein
VAVEGPAGAPHSYPCLLAALALPAVLVASAVAVPEAGHEGASLGGHQEDHQEDHQEGPGACPGVLGASCPGEAVALRASSAGGTQEVGPLEGAGRQTRVVACQVVARASAARVGDHRAFHPHRIQVESLAVGREGGLLTEGASRPSQILVETLAVGLVVACLGDPRGSCRHHPHQCCHCHQTAAAAAAAVAAVAAVAEILAVALAAACPGGPFRHLRLAKKRARDGGKGTANVLRQFLTTRKKTTPKKFIKTAKQTQFLLLLLFSGACAGQTHSCQSCEEVAAPVGASARQRLSVQSRAWEEEHPPACCSS